MSDTPSFKSEVVETITTKLKNSPNIANTIKDIGIQIASTGMSVEDCCLMVDFSYNKLIELMREIPEIETYFNIKRAKYKSDLLSILHTHAREAGDHKMALQLLSLAFPEEFDSSVKKANAKNSKEDSSDALQKLVKRIQKSAPPSPVAEAKVNSDREKQTQKDVYELSHLVNE